MLAGVLARRLLTKPAAHGPDIERLGRVNFFGVSPRRTATTKEIRALLNSANPLHLRMVSH